MIAELQTINCSFNDQNSLYLAYMPFVKNGGLFIRNYQNIKVGTHVLLTIHLYNENGSDKVEAKVIWLTPIGAQGNKPAGVGVQFLGENHQDFRYKIETKLADMLKSIHVTDTM